MRTWNAIRVFSARTVTGPDFCAASSNRWKVATTCGSRPAEGYSSPWVLQKGNWLRLANARPQFGHVHSGCTAGQLTIRGAGEEALPRLRRGDPSGNPPPSDTL